MCKIQVKPFSNFGDKNKFSISFKEFKIGHFKMYKTG